MSHTIFRKYYLLVRNVIEISLVFGKQLLQLLQDRQMANQVWCRTVNPHDAEMVRGSPFEYGNQQMQFAGIVFQRMSSIASDGSAIHSKPHSVVNTMSNARLVPGSILFELDPADTEQQLLPSAACDHIDQSKVVR